MIYCRMASTSKNAKACGGFSCFVALRQHGHRLQGDLDWFDKWDLGKVAAALWAQSRDPCVLEVECA